MPVAASYGNGEAGPGFVPVSANDSAAPTTLVFSNFTVTGSVKRVPSGPILMASANWPAGQPMAVALDGASVMVLPPALAGNVKVTLPAAPDMKSTEPPPAGMAYVMVPLFASGPAFRRGRRRRRGGGGGGGVTGRPASGFGAATFSSSLLHACRAAMALIATMARSPPTLTLFMVPSSSARCGGPFRISNKLRSGVPWARAARQSAIVADSSSRSRSQSEVHSLIGNEASTLALRAPEASSKAAVVKPRSLRRALQPELRGRAFLRHDRHDVRAGRDESIT